MKELAPDTLWQTVLGDLQLQVPRPTYDTWLRETRGITLSGNSLTVSVPSPFAAEWLERRMFQLIQRTIRKVTRQALGVTFQVGKAISLRSSVEGPITSQKPRGASLNKRYTFNSFVVGASNRLAYDAAMAVTESPEQSYSPLFIYAGVGMGKTHLLHAVAHASITRGLNLLFVTSEQFTNEFIAALRNHGTEDFRSRYRGVDVLLIDDIDFIGGKVQTQESFFHTFNSLHNSGSKIILTSDRPPRSLDLLGDRLRSRLEWGLMANIKPPDLETRKMILRAKATLLEVILPEEVVHLVSTKIYRNIRELEGVLNGIVSNSRASGVPITPSLASQTLQDIVPPPSHSSRDYQQVLEAVAAHYGMPVNSLTGTLRTREVSRARQVSMYILREEFHFALKSIASTLGRSNHTTVIHGVSKIKSQLDTDSSLQQDVSGILGSLGLQLPLSA